VNADNVIHKTFVCIDNEEAENFLTVGKTYKGYSHTYNDVRYTRVLLEGGEMSFRPSRFIDAESLGMSKTKIYDILKRNGFSDKQIAYKSGGVEVTAKYRNQVYEFDYEDFLKMFRDEASFDESKFHWLDQWTFTIECNPFLQ